MTTGRPTFLVTMALSLATGAAVGAWWASGDFGAIDWGPSIETALQARRLCLAGCVVSLVLLILAWQQLGRPYREGGVSGLAWAGLTARVAGPVGLLSLGLGLGIGSVPTGQRDHLLHRIGSDTELEWLGRAGPTIRSTRTGGYRMTLEAIAFRTPGGYWASTRGLVQVTLSADRFGDHLPRYGDLYHVWQGPKVLTSRPSRTTHPDEDPPDWARINRQRGVWLSQYLGGRSRGDIRLVEAGARWHPYVWAARAAEALGGRIGAALVGVGGEGAAPVALALVTGHLTGMDPATLRAYQTTGTMHLLVVSGAHLAVLAWGLALLLGRLPGRWAGENRWRVRLLAIGVLWGYALIAGLGQSVCRAVLMITLYEALSLAGRRPAPLTGLALVATVMIIARPLLCWQVGFWLSVGAVAGIVLLTGPLTSWMTPGRQPGLLSQSTGPDPAEALWGRRSWGGRWVRQALAVSVAAWLATAPVLLVSFGRVPLWGALVNVPAAVLGQGALWASLATAALGPLPVVGPWAARVCAVMVDTLQRWVTWAARWPGAGTVLARMPLLPALALGLAVLLALSLWRRPGTWRAWGAVGALVAGVVLWHLA